MKEKVTNLQISPIEVSPLKCNKLVGWKTNKNSQIFTKIKKLQFHKCIYV